jgi:hypothetical protein
MAMFVGGNAAARQWCHDHKVNWNPQDRTQHNNVSYVSLYEALQPYAKELLTRSRALIDGVCEAQAYHLPGSFS